MSDDLESIRVISREEAARAIDVSSDTWDRMEKRGETPPVTRLSQRRIGYRVIDLKEWLDRRRVIDALGQERGA
jgi:predicted DNA-binding transcriptional regulator AlpA